MSNSSGNVLFLILIAVALFAALSYAVTSSNRSGGANTSKERADLMAAQILNDVVAIRASYRRLITSCGLDKMDLDETPNTPDRRNPLSPAASGDFSCSLFHPDGGGERTDRLPAKAFINENKNNWRHTRWISVPEVGIGGSADLVLATRGPIRQDVCEALNRKLTGSPNIPVLNGNIDFFAYEGVIPPGGDGFSTNTPYGEYVMCFQHLYSGSNDLGIYSVLEPL